MSGLIRFSPALLLAAATFISLPALADDARYNQVSLRAEVSQEVAHDQMYVTLFSEEQSDDPAKLAANITNRMNQATTQARKVAGVKVSLGSRNSYPVYDDKGKKIIAWRERAELRLESKSFAALSQLSADLLGPLQIAGMSFSVSDATRKEVEDQLLKQAVQAFQARAQLASEALGGKQFKLVSLNLNSNGFQQPMPMRMGAMKSSMMSDSAPAQTIEAGTSQVQMNADGVIEVLLP